jgi:hypothetical protein
VAPRHDDDGATSTSTTTIWSRAAIAAIAGAVRSPSA